MSVPAEAMDNRAGWEWQEQTLARWRAEYEETEMGLHAKATGGEDFPPIPLGTHVARCIGVFDIGTQPGSSKFPTPRHQIVIMWELPMEKMEDGRPFGISKFYKLSWHSKSTLYKHVVSWQGLPKTPTPAEMEDFNIVKVVGAPCQITVSQDESGRETVDHVSRLMKGIQCPAQVNPSRTFSFEDGDEPAGDLPDFVSTRIKDSPEYKSRHAVPSDGPTDDDVAPWDEHPPEAGGNQRDPMTPAEDKFGMSEDDLDSDIPF